MPEDSLLRKQIILLVFLHYDSSSLTYGRTDYQIACSSERDVFLLKDSDLETSMKALDAYPTFLETPLLPSQIRFINICSTLDISRPAAEILDDMKFLTTSILDFRAMSPTPQDLLKFQATVLWTHNRISALPSSTSNLSDPIYEALRLTALIYGAAILSRQPLSVSSTAAQFQELGEKTWHTPLTRWKKMPGILLWIILVACPCPADNKLHKKFLKMIIATVAMHIGVEHHEVAVTCMRSFLGVQRWIEEAADAVAVEIAEEEGGDVQGKGKAKLIASASGSRSASRSGKGSIAEEISSREEPRVVERLGVP
jgi:hypothetical protein